MSSEKRPAEKISGISELVGHAKRACAEEAGGDKGPKYAAALFAQVAALRTAASMLEVAGMRALLRIAPKPETPEPL